MSIPDPPLCLNPALPLTLHLHFYASEYFLLQYTLPSLHPITPETTQGPGGASTTRLNVLKKAQYKRTYRNKHQNSKLLQLYYYYRDFPPKFLSFSIFIKLDFRVGLFV